MTKGNLLFAQSGGPTAVINASACGVIRTALAHADIDRVLCARYGIDGVLKQDFVDASQLDTEQIDLLINSPASAFGSCRTKLPTLDDTAVYSNIRDIFEQNNIRYFVYNGGNDSMDTINKIARYFDSCNYQCACVGVPKTVDNDLAVTDHCPGYGSSAKFIATTMHEIALDTAVYARGRVTIVEAMGRDTGWLVGAAALATAHGAGPDLIYLPETTFDIEDFAQQCKKIMTDKGRCLVAVAEGIKDSNGQFIATVAHNTNDTFAHTQLGGVCYYLAEYLTTQHNIHSRAIELSLPQRCASHIASKVDTHEAYLVGATAVQRAVQGITNAMVVIVRTSNSPYTVELDTVCIDQVANAIRYVPEHFIDTVNHCMTAQYIEYALPLIQGETTLAYHNGLPRYSRIMAGKQQ